MNITADQRDQNKLNQHNLKMFEELKIKIWGTQPAKINDHSQPRQRLAAYNSGLAKVAEDSSPSLPIF